MLCSACHVSSLTFTTFLPPRTLLLSFHACSPLDLTSTSRWSNVHPPSPLNTCTSNNFPSTLLKIITTLGPSLPMCTVDISHLEEASFNHQLPLITQTFNFALLPLFNSIPHSPTLHLKLSDLGPPPSSSSIFQNFQDIQSDWSKNFTSPPRSIPRGHFLSVMI